MTELINHAAMKRPGLNKNNLMFKGKSRLLTVKPSFSNIVTCLVNLRTGSNLPAQHSVSAVARILSFYPLSMKGNCHENEIVGILISGIAAAHSESFC
jgi:hypothetical protein